MLDATQPAANNPGRAAEAVGPSYRGVSLQRTLLRNSLQGVCQAAAPKSPYQQPVLDQETRAEQTSSSRAAQAEPRQYSSSPDTGKLSFQSAQSAPTWHE